MIGPFGNPTTMDRLLRIRIFDTWAHEQDIRAAIGQDGGWDTPAAAVSQEQIVRALPYVWARTVGAPDGSTVRIEVTGPDMPRDVGRDGCADGQGRRRRARSRCDRVAHGLLAGPHAPGLRSRRP